MSRSKERRRSNGFVIENRFFLGKGDGIESESESLSYLQEVFRGKLDPDVVHMVFTESGNNVENSLESLFTLAKASECSIASSPSSPPSTPPPPPPTALIVNENLLNSRHQAKSEMEEIKQEKDYVNALKTARLASSSSSAATAAAAVANVQLVPNKSSAVSAPKSLVDEITAAIKNGELLLVIMRGLPGSGKSTLANKLVRYTKGVVHSTDDYFASKNNVYHYDWTKLEEAHAWNQKRTAKAAEKRVTPIFVDNTNLEAWETRAYVKIGYENGYTMHFLEPETSWRYKIGNLAKYNKHGIPREKLERMADKFDRRVTVADVIKSLQQEKRLPLLQSNDAQASVSKAEVDGCQGSKNQRESPPKIGLDLLMILNQKTADSETSSVNASDGASSASQEGLWEKDEEFTWSTNSSVLEEANPKPQRGRKKCKQTEALTNWSTNSSNSNDGWEEEEQSREEQEEQKRPGRKLLSGLKKGDWQFPAFPANASCEATAEMQESDRFVYYQCRSTQSESKDWALLEAKQNNSDNGDIERSDSSTNLNGSSDVIAVPSNRVIRSFRVDRGTSTGDHPGYVSFDEKLAQLQERFPRAHYTHLREVLNSCHEDFQWAFNLLKDFSEQHFSSSDLAGISVNKMSGKDTLGPVPSEDTSFSLKLDPTFCAQLQSVFGIVADDLTEEKMIVNVSHGIAKLLHHCWRKTRQQQQLKHQQRHIFDSIGPKAPRPVSPEKQPQKTTESTSSILNEAPKSHLQEIMDLEMALNLSWNEFYSEAEGDMEANKELLSTKLKREQLYNTYPGIDRQVLEELFEANQYRISDTIATIDQSLGVIASLTPATEVWVTAEAVEHGNRVRSPGRSATYRAALDRNSDPDLPTSPVKCDSSNDFSGLRTKILEYHRKRRESNEKARTAYQSKQYAVASYYSSQSREYQQKIDGLSKQLVEDVLSANKSKNLDLHGLHSSEVLIAVSSFLSLKMEELKRNGQNKTHVDIITGWGAHSYVAPKIKPIVLNYLQSKKYRYEIINPGVIRVTVP